MGKEKPGALIVSTETIRMAEECNIKMVDL